MTDPAESALANYLDTLANRLAIDLDDAVEWEAMSSRNSRWYIQLGAAVADWDPCGIKRAFAFTLGRVDDRLESWPRLLESMQPQMQTALLALSVGTSPIGDVSRFRLPEAITLILAGGDMRYGMPPAGVSRGLRAAVFTNLASDQSFAPAEPATSYSAAILDAVTPELSSASAWQGTVLHELCHHLGAQPAILAYPSTRSRVAAELAAETGALFLIGWLRERGIINRSQASELYERRVTRSLAHAALPTDAGRWQTYSASAIIVLTGLMEQGALRWDDQQATADGAHTGALSIHLDHMHAAASDLAGHVQTALQSGNDEAVTEMIEHALRADTVPVQTLRQRAAAAPRRVAVYSITW
jgi:hypothetical protein